MNPPGSPEAKSFKPIDYLKITATGFALSALWNSLNAIIMPLLMLTLVAPAQKSTYLSIIVGSGLLLAVITQPIAGAVSDRSHSGLGRRRPFILLGIVLTLFLLPGIGFFTSYWTIFAIYCLLQISANTAQGAYQGFVPDLVPEGNRGLASGIKTLMELGGGLIMIQLVALIIQRPYSGTVNPGLWYSLIILGIILLAALLVTMLLVREKASDSVPPLPLRAALRRSFRIDGANTGFIWFLVSRLLVLTAFVTLQKFALYYLMDFTGLPNPALVTANLLIAIGLSALLATGLAGYLADRIGQRRIAITSALIGALGIMVLFFAPSYGYIILGGSIVGLAAGAFMSANWALAVNLLPPGEEARYLGLTNIATAGSSALTLFAIGPIIDFFNTRQASQGYSVMFLICFVYAIIGSLAMLKIKVHRQPK